MYHFPECKALSHHSPAEQVRQDIYLHFTDEKNRRAKRFAEGQLHSKSGADLEPQGNTEAAVVLTVTPSSGLDGQDDWPQSLYFLELEGKTGTHLLCDRVILGKWNTYQSIHSRKVRPGWAKARAAPSPALNQSFLLLLFDWLAFICFFFDTYTERLFTPYCLNDL